VIAAGARMNCDSSQQDQSPQIVAAHTISTAPCSPITIGTGRAEIDRALHS
jgi:hypothetical protein